MKSANGLGVAIMLVALGSAACHDDAIAPSDDAGDVSDNDSADATDAIDDADTGPRPTPELLREWARVPPENALDTLETWIFETDLDAYTRERAVFTAVEIATRQNQPGEATELLGLIATSTALPEQVRSAAWANLRILQSRFGHVPALTLGLAIEGETRVGSTLTIRCDAAAPAESDEARLNVEVGDAHGALVAHRIFDVATGSSTEPVVLTFTPAEPGEYYVSVDLRADHSAVSTERVVRRARIVVGEDSGSVFVFDD